MNSSVVRVLLAACLAMRSARGGGPRVRERQHGPSQYARALVLGRQIAHAVMLLTLVARLHVPAACLQCAS